MNFRKYLDSFFFRSTLFWIASRLLLSKDKKILSTTGWISLAGLILGVGSLVVSMAVISGFESTLRKNVSDVAGHIQIFKLNPEPEPWESLLEKIKKIEPSVERASRFAMVEGVLAHKGKLNGILLQGVDFDHVEKVLDLRSRLKSGEFKLTTAEDSSAVLIGKGLAKDFSLKPGDDFRVVVPLNTDYDVGQFKRQIGKLKVAGILDLGKYEYDQRWVFMSLGSLQNLAGIGSRYSGLLLRTKDISKARESSLKLSHELGSEFRVRDWKDINENLFEAIKIEKVVIFFVIFVIVVAAAFNVASSLYINVIRSYPEIATLKALGLSQKKLIQLFSIQGFLMGSLGCLIGIFLGFTFCFGFVFLQNHFGIFPGSVYKIDHIDLQIRFMDLLIIVISTLLICFVATWAPARRASLLTTVEGLRNE